jgi:hypothetical protein
MREYFLRILKTGLPTMLLLGALGVLLSEYAGNMIQTQQRDRQVKLGTTEDGRASTNSGEELASQLRVRLSLTMAAWGLGLVMVMELLRAMWVPPASSPADSEPAAEPRTVDELLNELAIRVEAESRKPANQP